MNIGNSISGALFADEERLYRLVLWRIWNRILPALMFVGLNPSTAAEIKDDPTVVRMADFAKRWGFGGLYMTNLYPVVSASPAILLIDAAKYHLTENDKAIKQVMGLTQTRVVGWGEFGMKLGTRPTEVLSILGNPVYCLKVNKSGEPCHPLYLPNYTKLIEYKRGEDDN